MLGIPEHPGHLSCIVITPGTGIGHNAGVRVPDKCNFGYFMIPFPASSAERGDLNSSKSICCRQMFQGMKGTRARGKRLKKSKAYFGNPGA